jgi:hypothetical protein
MVNGNMTTTVSCSLLITSRRTTNHGMEIQGMSIGEMILELTLDKGHN